MKERWYLYGNDAALALDLLREDLRRAGSSGERAALVRFLPNLGRHEEAAIWLRERQPELLNEVHGRATWMRVLQHRGDENPWLAMLPPEQAPAFHQYSQELLDGRQPLDLWLGGGLGDQLECLARLHNGLSQHSLFRRLRLVFPPASRQAMEPLLASWWPPAAPRWCFAGGPPRSLDQRPWISLIPLYAVLSEAGLFAPAGALVDHSRNQRSQPPALLCCWRSKVDPAEKLWAHLRSLPFTTVLQVYEQLIPEAQASGLEVLDITRYQAAETAALERFAPCLRLMQPSLSSLADTTALLLQSRAVVSVDTAVVHLATWFNWPTLLLLHQHPDERWRTTPGNIRTLRQVRYNHWSDLPARLTAMLRSWPPLEN